VMEQSGYNRNDATICVGSLDGAYYQEPPSDDNDKDDVMCADVLMARRLQSLHSRTLVSATCSPSGDKSG